MTRGKTLEQLYAQDYQEESVKPAIITMLLVVMVVALPLSWMIHKIGDEGFDASEISKYNALAALVGDNISTIQKILENDIIDEDVLSGVTLAAPMVTLITPDIGPTNMGEAISQNSKQLNIKLKAIYWNPRDPLVTIGDDNYRVGEKIQGFTITEIRKTEVVFRSPLGDTVVKYFYDYLDTPKRK